MKLFRSLNNSLKTGIITMLVALVGFLGTLFLLFNGHKDIPLGIALGGVVIGGLNILSGLLEKKDEAKASSIRTFIAIGLRLAVIVVMMIIIALMYYRWDLPLFNIFAFVGVYTVSVIVLVVLFLKERRQ